MGNEKLGEAGAPDPARVATSEDFGRELSLARERAGLTVRDAARAAGVPVSTAGDYFTGRHLPSPAQPDALRKLLAACQIEDPAQVSAWAEAARRARRAPGRRPAGAPAPWPGLAAFQPEDAAWFFGRDDLTGRLMTAAAAPGAPPLPLILTGASGSGKSSLLRAGLMPRLAAGGGAAPAGRPVVLLTPGAEPMAALAARLPPGAAHGEGTAPAVIVDQFEEVFAACPEEGQRREFIAAVCELSARTLVVLGLRADFYAYALRYPQLARALQERQVVVGPMTQDQMRQAITEPARRAKLSLEPGLTELVLRDLAPAGEGGGPEAPGHEAGALPFLSHALRATWDRDRGGRLTVAAYQASGGIRDAIANTAEAAYASLGSRDKALARQLFLRLVLLTDDARLTRARLPLGELGQAAGDEVPDGPLATFVAARLITLDADTAQLTHEALLSAWPRLRGWIDADRDGARTRRHLTAAAQAWLQAGRDAEALLRGGPLAAASEWAGDPPNRASLPALAREFLDTAVAHQQAQQAAGRRRTRRLRQLVAALTVLAAVTVGLAGYSFRQRQDATAARNQADSRAMAVEAGQVRAEDPSLAAQLSLAAYRVAPTPDALASLLKSTASPAAARVQDSRSVVESVALAPGGRLLAAVSADGTLRLWDVARPGHPTALGGPLARLAGSLFTTAFSPAGHLLAAAGADGRVRLWNVADPRHPVPLGPPLAGPGGTVYSVAFSPHGRLLAAGGAGKTVRLWNVAGPGRPVPLGQPLTGAGGFVEAVAFSPDGHYLAAGTAASTVRLWDISVPRRPVPAGPALTGPAGIVDTVAFSPDGRTLAAGSRDNSVWLWNVSDPAHPVTAHTPLTDATDWVNAVAFSPHGRVLAGASSDNQVLLWSTATGALLGTLPEPQPVTSLAWDGARALASGGADGTVRLWQVPPPVLLSGGPVNQVAYGPGGRLLAVAGPSLQLWDMARRTLVGSAAVPGSFPNTAAFAPGGAVLASGWSDGKVRLWRAGPGGSLAPLGRPVTASASGLVEYVAFRRDGRILASGADDGTVRLWDVADPVRPRLLATLRDSGTYVFSVAFSPDGRTLAAASADNLTRLWDVADPVRPRPLGTLRGPASYAISVAFSPDGRALAVGSADRTVRLWDVTDRSRPRPLTGPLTGPGGYVYSLAFSPHGRRLAAGVTDGTIWLWDVARPADPALITKLTDAASTTAHVYTVAFSPGGASLAAGSSNGSVRLWATRPAAAAAAVCATAAAPLTPAEWASYAPGRPYSPPCAG